MSLQAAIEWIQDQALTISGVGAAPDNPTDTAFSSKLFVIAYPSGGEISTASAGWGRDFDNITVQILTQRGELKEAMQRLEGFPHNLARKIQADVSLGGNVSTFENMTYQFVTLTFGGVEHVGYVLTLNRVKTLTTH